MKLNKLHLGIAALLLIVSIGFLVFSNQGGNPFQSANGFSEKLQPGLHEVHLQIDGMWCESCAYGIKYTLEKQEGVVEANIDAFAGEGFIKYAPSKISKERISELTRPYPSRIVSDYKI